MCPTCMVLTDSHHVPTIDTLTGMLQQKYKKYLKRQKFFSKGGEIFCWVNTNLQKLELLPYFLRHI